MQGSSKTCLVSKSFAIDWPSDVERVCCKPGADLQRMTLSRSPECGRSRDLELDL